MTVSIYDRMTDLLSNFLRAELYRHEGSLHGCATDRTRRCRSANSIALSEDRKPGEWSVGETISPAPLFDTIRKRYIELNPARARVLSWLGKWLATRHSRNWIRIREVAEGYRAESASDRRDQASCDPRGMRLLSECPQRDRFSKPLGSQ